MLTFVNKGSNGSIIVDAACSLPIFIIAMGLVLMLIAQAGIEDTVSYAMTEASEDVVLLLAGSNENPGDALAFTGFSLGLKSKLAGEWGDDSPRVRLAWLHGDLDFCLDGGIKLDNLVSANVGIGTCLPFASVFPDTRYVGRDILFRPWVGESRQDETYDDTRVFIFPKRGEHYHCSACSCLKNGEVQTVLTDKLRKKHNACQTCQSGMLPNGAAVFLMSSGSAVFHRRTCPCIIKAYECVSLSDARSMGYSPCGLCGGTSENYSPDADYFR